MIRAAFLALLLTTPLTAQTPPGKTTVQLNGHTFTLPEGFTIELAAKMPLVDRPISGSFDDQGRLYVTISSGSNARGPQQAEEKSHRMVRLEDTDGDGVFDKSVVFADKLAMPQGVLWHQGHVYTATPPQILKLTDTDGDGKADKREVWHQGTVTGCMNDLHGPWLGPDGWIYWTKGAWQQQTYQVNGKDFTTRACHIFRCRPDGTGLEPIMTGGMDNPVGLAFTPTGERIVSGTFFQFPADGKRDGLIHAVYGGIYGKDHDPIHDPVHKWTSPHVLPIMTHLGAAAPCGMTRFESHLFGKEYQDNLFCCLFNMQKVTRHVLVPDGATYKTLDSDFVVSDQKDFHPTDVVEDADGSLLIIDTGGWYKICCPTSQLVKPEVFGAIYRVRRVGGAKLADPWGFDIDWDKLTAEDVGKLFDDPRVRVRKEAVAWMPRYGLEGLGIALGILGKGEKASAEARRNALWVSTRSPKIDVANGRTRDATTLAMINLFNLALSDRDESVVLTAAHCSGLLRLCQGARMGGSASQNPKAKISPLVLRAQAELVGRNDRANAIGSGAARTLLPVLQKSNDPFLDHSIIYSLIAVGDVKATENALSDPSPAVRRGALIALSQMDAGAIREGNVLKELDSDDAALGEAAWWIAGQRPEWAKAIATHLAVKLRSKTLTTQQRAELINRLAPHAKSPAIQHMLASFAASTDVPAEVRASSLKAMADVKLKEAPVAWLTALQTLFDQGDAKLQQEAVAASYALRLPKSVPPGYFESLYRIGMNPKTAPLTRTHALAAITTFPSEKAAEPELLAFLISQVKVDQPAAQRGFAATALSRQRLTSEQLLTLAEALPDVGPLELDRVLDAFSQSKDEKVGAALLSAFENPKLRAALRADIVKTRLAKFGPEMQKKSEGLIRALNADVEKQQARLEALLVHVKEGDVGRGQAIFNSQKSACVVCHSIGYLGGKVGPDLTRIGGIRTERDLLEAIVFPSASFVRSYEPVLVLLNDGKTVNGLVKRETPEELLLVTGVNQEVRVARADIDEIQPSKVSIMPAGLEQQLTVQELADLVAFLKANK